MSSLFSNCPCCNTSDSKYQDLASSELAPLNQVCFSREWWKTGRTSAFEDRAWTPCSNPKWQGCERGPFIAACSCSWYFYERWHVQECVWVKIWLWHCCAFACSPSTSVDFLQILRFSLHIPKMRMVGWITVKLLVVRRCVFFFLVPCY